MGESWSPEDVARALALLELLKDGVVWFVAALGFVLGWSYFGMIFKRPGVLVGRIDR